MNTNRLIERRKQKGSALIAAATSHLDGPFIEILSRIAIDVVWIEMEHSGLTFQDAETLCSLINGNGMLSMIRLPNAGREAVLKGAETGADILVAPMVNDVATCREFGTFARYAPQGERGFFSNSRAMQYGMETLEKARNEANENLTVLAQVETRQALELVSEYCALDGIDGLLFGLGDLSSEMGVPGKTDHPSVLDPVLASIETCRRAGKLSATISAPSDLATWMQRDMDLLAVGNRVSFLAGWAKQLHQQIQAQHEILQSNRENR